MATVQQSQPGAMEVKISSSGSSGSRPLHVISPGVTPGATTPVEQPRSTTVILQASSSSSGSGAQSPSKPIPAPLQLNSPSSPAPPSNVVLIRPAPVLSPTSRSAPGGGFFIHTGTVSNGPSAVSTTTTTPQPVVGNSITIQPQQRQPVVLQQNPVAAPPVAAASSQSSPGARSSFNIVSSSAVPTQAAPPAAPAPAAQPPQAVVTAPLLPHEHITTLVKTADVPRPVADVVDAPPAVIRAPSAKSSVEKKGPPPMTPRELLATAEPMWVCGFALAVMAVAFIAMANEGEIPISYILSGVVFTSLAAFVKLRL